MPSYVVTGASRGLGYAFVEHLAKDPANVVFGLVRNKSATDKKLSEEKLTSTNIHIVAADITDRASLQAARKEIEKHTTSIDYLINNAAFIPEGTAFTSLADHEDNPEVLEADLRNAFEVNVLGPIYTINALLPLIRNSSIKKVIVITTGLADDGLTNDFELYEGAPYAISKSAVNTVVAKYNARFGSEGVLFLGISPGLVDTGNSGAPPADSEMPKKFAKAFPHFTGPITPEESVNKVLAVIERASVEDKLYAGGFVSHFGNKQWL